MEKHAGPHISIKAEPIFHFFGLNVTNSLILSAVVLIFFLILAVTYSVQSTGQKKGLYFYFLTSILKYFYNLFGSILNEKIWIFFPLLASFFFFILFQNWFGLLPGVGSILIREKVAHEYLMVPLFRSTSADLNGTLTLALISFIIIQASGFYYLGFRGYIGKFINFKNPLNFFTGILEAISEFSKILSFSFRLFGNIFAGEVLIAVMAFLVPVLLPFPFFILEVFVGLIQAIVFAMLTAVFINLAITPHH